VTSRHARRGGEEHQAVADGLAGQAGGEDYAGRQAIFLLLCGILGNVKRR
jgi:hypothetical protein